MHPQWWSRLVALVLLAVGLSGSLSTSASAEPTIKTLSAPEVEPKNVFAHGDGSVTIANSNCATYPEKSEENGAVTISPEGSVLSEIPRVEGEWNTLSCVNNLVAGFDNTTYITQAGQAAKNYPYRVIATRNGARLWADPIPYPGKKCSSKPARIQSMALGQDGNLYVATYWPYTSGPCPEQDGIASIDPATGVKRFNEILPYTGSSVRSFSEIMPYENGVAILNGNKVFYYNFEGEVESGKTFTAASGEEVIAEMKIVPETGRIYWLTMVYNPKTNKWEKTVFYRDMGGSTNEKVTLSGEKILLGISITPSNGVVIDWQEESGTKGFSYVNEAGSVVYEQVLTTETGATVQDAGLPWGLMVDDFGNVIVRRMIDQVTGDKDRNIVVDSFSPAGIKTRLFNSASLGTNEKVDSFTSTSALTQSMGEGYVYLALCHIEGKISSGCDATKNPIVISIWDSSLGTYDYPRSAIFGAGQEKLSYVALGDSYSSGEGVPDFIAPSDENGCHRSYDAYPVFLTSVLSPSLRLDAFVACSGAETIDVEGGMNGEQPQLKSLSSRTDIVTVTIGGNDIGFGAFAARCVYPFGSCDSSSAEYEYSMEEVEVLPANLEELYSEIESRSENAEIYVVGYPQVAPEPGTGCGILLTTSEEEAAREVVTALDEAIEEAVEEMGGGFTYVDPTTGTSPFIGHELCMEESYFNGATLPEKAYSFHPNMSGQHAYAELIYEAL
jgi:lysophospholipase L1-like esterase